MGLYDDTGENGEADKLAIFERPCDGEDVLAAPSDCGESEPDLLDSAAGWREWCRVISVPGWKG
jgi:hypothetical protein